MLSEVLVLVTEHTIGLVGVTLMSPATRAAQESNPLPILSSETATEFANHLVIEAHF